MGQGSLLKSWAVSAQQVKLLHFLDQLRARILILCDKKDPATSLHLFQKEIGHFEYSWILSAYFANFGNKKQADYEKKASNFPFNVNSTELWATRYHP